MEPTKDLIEQWTREAEQEYPHDNNFLPSYNDFQDASRDGWIAACRVRWQEQQARIAELEKIIKTAEPLIEQHKQASLAKFDYEGAATTKHLQNRIVSAIKTL